MSSILSLLKTKASSVADLRAKFDKLKSADPLAGIAELEQQRHAALMAGDDAKVVAIEAEVKRLELDNERKTVALADIEKQLAEAEAAELDERRAAAVKAAKSATKKTAALLERYTAARGEILTVLDALGDI